MIDKKTFLKTVTILYDTREQKNQHILAAQCAKQLTLIVENIGGWEELRSYRVPAWQMKANPQRIKEDIGAPVYSTLKSWQSGNRYRFFGGICAGQGADRRKNAGDILLLLANLQGNDGGEKE